jgi:hypothetical protein
MHRIIYIPYRLCIDIKAAMQRPLKSSLANEENVSQKFFLESLGEKFGKYQKILYTMYRKFSFFFLTMYYNFCKIQVGTPDIIFSMRKGRKRVNLLGFCLTMLLVNAGCCWYPGFIPLVLVQVHFNTIIIGKYYLVEIYP